MEGRKRSVLKAFSWRVIATFTTMSIVFAYTNEFALSIGVGVVEVLAKMALYYGHERTWARIRWGATSKDEKLEKGHSNEMEGLREQAVLVPPYSSS